MRNLRTVRRRSIEYYFFPSLLYRRRTRLTIDMPDMDLSVALADTPLCNSSGIPSAILMPLGRLAPACQRKICSEGR